jgi:hypothetical protein
MSGGTSVPAQKNLLCHVPQHYIPSLHFGSFHLFAPLACIHRHLFTNRFLFLFWWPVQRNLHLHTTVPSGYFAMGTILHFAACDSFYKLDWGYVLSHHWIGLSTIQQCFITGVAIIVCVKVTDPLSSVSYSSNYEVGTLPPMHHNLSPLFYHSW